MGLLLPGLVLLVGAAAALPRNYDALEALGNNRAEEQCSCIRGFQSRNGGLIRGQYSYDDPVGNNVTVTYEASADGSSYNENRVIIRTADRTFGETSRSEVLTEARVSQGVVTELKPVVVQIIRTTVTSHEGRVTDPAGLVEAIMLRLRSVVDASVRTALDSPRHRHLNAGVVGQRILLELRAFVEEGVANEVKLAVNVPSQEEIVRLAGANLQPVIVRVIEETVASMDESALRGSDAILSTVEERLRTEVTRVVTTTLADIPGAGSRLDRTSIVDQIIVELREFVKDSIRMQVETVRRTRTEETARVVETTVAHLEPTVVRIIREAVASVGGGGNVDVGSLTRDITARLTPIVEEQVNTALRSSTIRVRLDVTDVTRMIIAELRPFIQRGVQQNVEEMAQQLSETRAGIVRSVTARMRAVAIPTVQALFENGHGNDLDTASVTRQAMTTLRTSASNEVLRATAGASPAVANRLDSDAITDEVLLHLTPFVERQIGQQITAVTQRRQTNRNQLVTRIVQQLTPVIRETVSTSTRTESRSARPTTDVRRRPVVVRRRPAVSRTQTVTTTVAKPTVTREETILEVLSVLRPVIVTTVRQELGEDRLAGATTQQLIESIIGTLRPEIIEAVTRVINVSSTQDIGSSSADTRSIVLSVIEQLTPLITSSVETSFATQTVVIDRQVGERATQALLVTIQPVVRQIVSRTVAQQLARGLTKEQISTQIESQISHGQLVAMLESEYGSIVGRSSPMPSSQEFESLLLTLQPRLHSLIITEIETFISANPSIDAATTREIVSSVARSVQTDLVRMVGSVLESGADDESTMRSVASSLQASIFDAIESEVRSRGISVGAGFRETDAFDSIVSSTLTLVRRSIVNEIRSWRQRNVRVDVSPSANLREIFGLDGTNSVRVETREYNYQYETKK